MVTAGSPQHFKTIGACRIRQGVKKNTGPSVPVRSIVAMLSTCIHHRLERDITTSLDFELHADGNELRAQWSVLRARGLELSANGNELRLQWSVLHACGLEL